MQSQRCEGCDEPEFMCCCSKEFVGQEVSEVYHRGVYVGGKQAVREAFYLSVKITVVIGCKAFLMVSPYRHGDCVLRGVRV